MGQTDGQTLDRLINPALHSMRAASMISFILKLLITRYSDCCMFCRACIAYIAGADLTLYATMTADTTAQGWNVFRLPLPLLQKAIKHINNHILNKNLCTKPNLS